MPGASAYTTNLLRPFLGFTNINEQQTKFWDEFRSIQTSLNHRFSDGLGFGINYTLGLSLTGNTGLQSRFQHAPDGTISLRADQEAYEELNKNLALQKHVIKATPCGRSPMRRACSVASAYLLNDWQISSVLTAGSANHVNNDQPGGRYDITYNYQDLGTNTNLTGSPDYAARIVYVGDPAAGVPTTSTGSSIRRPSPGRPTASWDWNRDGIFSAGAPTDGRPRSSQDHTVWRQPDLQFRVDAFNVVVINNRERNVTYRSPNDLTIVNNQFMPDGSC